jgi:hypothetical protein
MRAALRILALAAICATALTACGGSKPAARKLTGSSKQYAASRCMRAHGVPNFPDPSKYGGNTVSMTPGSDVITIAGISFSGPAFKTAEKLCDPLGLASARPPITEQQKRKLIAFARCMRRHGLTNWADPTFPPGGGIDERGESAYSRSDPKVLAASAACNKRG